jgi:hypothetical protein
VAAHAVPRDQWQARFITQGMKHPEPRMRMLDGFNEGWIDFESAPPSRRRGQTGLDAVLQALV